MGKILFLKSHHLAPGVVAYFSAGLHSWIVTLGRSDDLASLFGWSFGVETA
jgi:hypothetical protein